MIVHTCEGDIVFLHETKTFHTCFLCICRTFELATNRICSLSRIHQNSDYMIPHHHFIIWNHCIIIFDFSCYICNFQGPSVCHLHCLLNYGEDRQKEHVSIQVKFDELRKLGDFLVDDHRMTFKKAYGNLLRVLSTREDAWLVFTFAKFYDCTLHCFTFQDVLLAPTLEEFAYLLHLPVKDQVPY